MQAIFLSPEGTLDYAAQFLDEFSHARVATGTPFQDEALAFRDGVANALRASEKYLFLNAKLTIDSANTGNLSLPALARMPAPVVCIEFPVPSLSPGGNSSSRRMALGLDIDAYRRHFPLAVVPDLVAGRDGVCVLSLVWQDRAREWHCVPGALFLPHAKEGASTRQASHGVRTLKDVVFMPLLPGVPGSRETSPGEAGGAAALGNDLIDEVQALLHALPLMSTDMIVLQRPTPPERIRQGRQPYFEYRVLGTHAPPVPVFSLNPFIDIGSGKADRHVAYFGFSSLRRLNTISGGPIRTQKDFLHWLGSLEKFEAAQINLFIGVNGAGKSTVLDLIACLADPTRLATMQRENTKSDTQAGFDVALRNSWRVIGRFSQRISREVDDALDWQSLALAVVSPEGELTERQADLKKFDPDVESLNPIAELMQLLDKDIEFYDADLQALDIESISAELSEIGPYLNGLASSMDEAHALSQPSFLAELWPRQRARPVEPMSGARVSMWLSDDLSQTNHVNLAQLPSGWRALASLLGWIKRRPEGSICLIEEPETHLHPRLQHLLARRLSSIARQRSLQLFISTHSAALIDSRSWQEITPKIFQADTHCLRETLADGHALRLMEDLGVRQSDFLQANGVVWVEGPSDAIYLEYWLRLYCVKEGKPLFERGLSYSIFWYGGSVLSHLAGERDEILRALLQLNRNAFVLMDSDLDYRLDAAGVPQSAKADHAKERVRTAIKQLESPSCGCWVTQGYTIENYLPAVFRDNYFVTQENGRLKQCNTTAKVEIARRFVNAAYDFDACFGQAGDLLERIASLYTVITRWNAL
ncbi:ATP-dependent nuclease [Achromobacter xylosoxidans]|uniref:ATPase AAA-type core domain-containing protein n=1 Tax=Alcaligenes xylosoxydans xylosoxydans TaxID=85698 RepID=A0A0X8NZ14_ALCXX|nr:ATP-binding protein [Achromobacter xylosoxidans]AMG36859.1 hypothetical protein AL504_12985 [Achromobacter xylosoxidans]